MSDQQNDSAAARAQAIAAELKAEVSRLRRRILEEAGPDDVTPSQVAVILRLEKDGTSTVSALARAEGVRPQSMRMTVAGLDALGFVAGAPDPGDGRQTVLSLTEQCRRWLSEGRAARQGWLARAISTRLSPDEQEQLAAATRLLKRLSED